MAKVPASNRFQLVAEIARDDIGRIMEMITLSGGNIVGCNMITDVHSWKGNTKSDGSIVDRVREIIRDTENDIFTTKQLIKQLREEGRESTNAIYSAMTQLIKDGVMQRTDKAGTYRKIGGLITHQPEQASSKEKSKEGKFYEKPNFQVILEHMKGRKKIKTIDLAEIFRKEGRPTTSMSSVVSKFTKQKPPLLKPTGEKGTYEVLTGNVTEYKASLKARANGHAEA